MSYEKGNYMNNLFKSKLRTIVTILFCMLLIAGCSSTSSNDVTKSNSDVSEEKTETVEDSLNEPDEDPSVSKEFNNAKKKAYTYATLMHMSKQAVYDQLTS